MFFLVDLLLGVEAVLAEIELGFLVVAKFYQRFEWPAHFAAKTLQRSHAPFAQ